MERSVPFFIYAALLVTGGLVAYFSAPPEANAMTALAVPGGAAAIVCILTACYLAAGRGKTTLGRTLYWAAIVVAFLFALAIGARIRPVMGDPDRSYLGPIFIALTVLSFAAGWLGVWIRPRPGPIAEILPPDHHRGEEPDAKPTDGHDRDSK